MSIRIDGDGITDASTGVSIGEWQYVLGDTISSAVSDITIELHNVATDATAFKFVFENLTVTTDNAAIRFQWELDNSGAVESGASHYDYAGRRSQQQGSSHNNLDGTGSTQTVCNRIGNASNEAGYIEIIIATDQTGTLRQHGWSYASTTDDATNAEMRLQAFSGGAGVLTQLYITPSAGNIDGGTYAVYKRVTG